MNIPNYDNWKLASKLDYSTDYGDCKYCGEILDESGSDTQSCAKCHKLVNGECDKTAFSRLMLPVNPTVA